jgi:Mg2+/Co2+ transporter CorB
VLGVKDSKELSQEFCETTKDILKVCSGIYFALCPERSGILSQLADFMIRRRRIMTIQELKQVIVDEVAAIDEDLRRRVYDNFQTRLQKCIDVGRRRPSA